MMDSKIINLIDFDEVTEACDGAKCREYVGGESGDRGTRLAAAARRGDVEGRRKTTMLTPTKKNMARETKTKIRVKTSKSKHFHCYILRSKCPGHYGRSYG